MGQDTTHNNFYSWVRYFCSDQQGVRWYIGDGYNSGCRLEALLAMWLSKFLFYDFPGDLMQGRFFPLAIKIAKGKRYPLASLFLGCLYHLLDLIHDDELKRGGHYLVDSHVMTSF
ncbi:PMD domain-containing protein [Cephalotus follicularis]|uniref:PMD domain-containing protein n=1 Tax=Cephalotus follicularis TaxID=3775 RepID=A0A1Q3CMC4_CEPFO|nr:PMD domain-containing protein [Cephalotus follicularis]